MFSKKDFETKKELAIYIGQNFGKKFKYKTVNVCRLNQDDSFQLITISKPDNEDIYLNLFVEEINSNYKIFVLKKIIGKYCLGELEENEKKIVFSNNNQLYSYGEMVLCMEDVSQKTIEEIFDYSNKTDNFQTIFINLSTVEKRRMVSEYIQNYMFLMEELKNIDSSSNYYPSLSTIDIKTEILDKIAKSCMYAKTAKKFLVKVINNDNWLNAKIHVLNRDNSYETLFLSVDTQNLAIFYLKPINGKWEKEILPNNIGEISKLFISGTSF